MMGITFRVMFWKLLSVALGLDVLAASRGYFTLAAKSDVFRKSTGNINKYRKKFFMMPPNLLPKFCTSRSKSFPALDEIGDTPEKMLLFQGGQM
jgi:hypothetical protein